MDITYRVLSARTKNGDTVSLPPTGVTCIVGANNVGKSQFLVDIERILTTTWDSSPVVLDSIQMTDGFPIPLTATLERSVSGHEEPSSALVDWLTRNAGAVGRDGAGTQRYSAKGSSQGATGRDIAYGFSEPRLPHQTAPFLLQRLGSLSFSSHAMGGEAELDASYPTLARRNGVDEKALAARFWDAFGVDLSFDPFTGADTFRLGAIDSTKLDGHRSTPALVAELREMRKIDEQGNGMKAYLSAIMPLVIGNAQVYLSDEPETYLHPPQARTLGRVIGTLSVERDFQLIVATHDRDFVAGLISSGCPLTIARIEREGDVNGVSQVETGAVKGIWNDPTLRYSNVLGGLFCKRVVVCEAESDCSFYQAVLDHLVESGELDPRYGDALFIGSNGKSGLARRVEALRTLNVDVSVIVDYDVFKDNWADAKKILEALGRVELETMREQFSLVKSDIVSNQLEHVVKRTGTDALSTPSARIAADSFMKQAMQSGLFVVPVGELEAFDPLSPHAKGSWIENALRDGVHETSEKAHAFVSQVVGATR